MKAMKCNQLGGACEEVFRAETFEEMANLSKQHGMDMFQKGDEAHVKAMQEMGAKMSNPASMQEWMDEKRREFDALPQE